MRRLEAKINALIKCKGLQPVLYVVIKDLHHSIIVKHRITGDVKVLGK